MKFAKLVFVELILVGLFASVSSRPFVRNEGIRSSPERLEFLEDLENIVRSSDNSLENLSFLEESESGTGPSRAHSFLNDLSTLDRVSHVNKVVVVTSNGQTLFRKKIVDGKVVEYYVLSLALAQYKRKELEDGLRSAIEREKSAQSWAQSSLNWDQRSYTSAEKELRTSEQELKKAQLEVVNGNPFFRDFAQSQLERSEKNLIEAKNKLKEEEEKLRAKKLEAEEKIRKAEETKKNEIRKVVTELREWLENEESEVRTRLNKNSNEILQYEKEIARIKDLVTRYG